MTEESFTNSINSLQSTLSNILIRIENIEKYIEDQDEASSAQSTFKRDEIINTNHHNNNETEIFGILFRKSELILLVLIIMTHIIGICGFFMCYRSSLFSPDTIKATKYSKVPQIYSESEAL